MEIKTSGAGFVTIDGALHTSREALAVAEKCEDRKDAKRIRSAVARADYLGRTVYPMGRHFPKK